MSVLEGEGRVPILFGSGRLPLPPHHAAYIARPDVEGEHPTVIIAHDSEGVTPGIKALARHVSRHGYSVLVPDMTRGAQPDSAMFEWDVGDLAAGVRSARTPGTEWASPQRIALVGLGAGGLAAAVVAAEAEAAGLVLVGASLESELLTRYSGAVLVLHGVDDDLVPGDEVREVRTEVGRGEWILYGGVGSGFIDEGSPGFDQASAADARERMIAFFDRLLTPAASPLTVTG